MLENDKQVLNNEKIELSNDITKLTAEKDDLLKTKENLTKEKENLTTNLSNAKSQLSQTSQKLRELEQKHAPYDKLEKLYEVFLEVKECLIFEFVKDTHSAMDLIGYVLSDSKYYVEEIYRKTQQELRNKNSDKGEKLVALFDLLFECIKDKKFKRLETPSSYNSACIALYPEQSSTGNIQRVVLRGYSYNDKTMPSIVDMGG
ncbi:M protein [Helicobacter pylori]|uniref:M protein n=1 Tax=Helicobacter pylori TaxID=210 RepID=UPI00040D3E5F|nr:M protein [Helicobacter pylori]